MDRAFHGYDAWMTSMRRDSAWTRRNTPIVSQTELDGGHTLVKINPIVAWSDADVDRYIAEHDIIVNPLRGKGFDSIGCAPCTVPGSGRRGRWAGSGRLECGLHLVGGGG